MSDIAGWLTATVDVPVWVIVVCVCAIAVSPFVIMALAAYELDYEDDAYRGASLDRDHWRNKAQALQAELDDMRQERGEL